MQVDYSKVKKIYFMGIAGTGMAAVAGMCQQAGFSVCGSDGAIYPPMSTMLERLGIKVFTPYDPANLDAEKPDLFVVANALSRGHKELEAGLSSGIPYTSFPALLGEHFLKSRVPVVVTGTHGKTTTSTMMSYCLAKLGAEPGYFIGGAPHDLPSGFEIGKGPFFVLEGDEYDTAFFDKASKFHHYRPQFLMINAIEFDHADIFANLEAVKSEFIRLIRNVSKPEQIIVNANDEVIRAVCEDAGIWHKVTKTAPYKATEGATVTVTRAEAESTSSQKWVVELTTKSFGKITVKSHLAGGYNAANIAQVVATFDVMKQSGAMKDLTAERLVETLQSFRGVKRRLELLASVGGVDIYEDFAHHPTAVEHVIGAMRKTCPGRRLIVAFEPKNATGRRNVFENEYVRVFGLADHVFIGECPLDLRIPEDRRMDTFKLAKSIGSQKASAFKTNDDLLKTLAEEAKSGDVVIFMSSGSFSGCQHRLKDALATR